MKFKKISIVKNFLLFFLTISIISLILSFFYAIPYLGYLFKKEKLKEDITLENVWVIVNTPPKYGNRRINFLIKENGYSQNLEKLDRGYSSQWDIKYEDYYALCHGLENLICHSANLKVPILLRKITMIKSIDNLEFLVKEYQIGERFYKNTDYDSINQNPIKIHLKSSIFILKLSFYFTILYLITYFTSRIYFNK